MKIILGDNQFFGVNHFDLSKGQKTKEIFNSTDKIANFINDSLELGLDGFMINSNDFGFKVLDKYQFDTSKEIHYSIPYPHKYAAMVNENGLLSLGKHVFKHMSLFNIITQGIKFLFTRNFKHIIRPILEIEIPKNLKKGSYVYLQNIVTDLLIGIGREDLLIAFIKEVVNKGFKPGIITLNPIVLDKSLNSLNDILLTENLVVCFNINKGGFNVFPEKNEVEKFIDKDKNYKLMGMSILSSGGAEIFESLNYIKALDLDYVVFGSSKLSNIKSNLDLLISET